MFYIKAVFFLFSSLHYRILTFKTEDVFLNIHTSKDIDLTDFINFFSVHKYLLLLCHHLVYFSSVFRFYVHVSIWLQIDALQSFVLSLYIVMFVCAFLPLEATRTLNFFNNHKIKISCIILCGVVSIFSFSFVIGTCLQDMNR